LGDSLPDSSSSWESVSQTKQDNLNALRRKRQGRSAQGQL
jgi:hypothetical protein